MKKQADRNRKEVEKYRVGDKVLISTKDFSMKLMKRVMKKLTEKFIGLYVVRKIVSENVIELELLAVLRIHPVVKIVDSGLCFYFLFFFSLFLEFYFLFSFSIFRTTRVRVCLSRCHISHKLMA